MQEGTHELKQIEHNGKVITIEFIIDKQDDIINTFTVTNEEFEEEKRNINETFKKNIEILDIKDLLEDLGEDSTFKNIFEYLKYKILINRLSKKHNINYQFKDDSIENKITEYTNKYGDSKIKRINLIFDL